MCGRLKASKRRHKLAMKPSHPTTSPPSTSRRTGWTRRSNTLIARGNHETLDLSSEPWKDVQHPRPNCGEARRGGRGAGVAQEGDETYAAYVDRSGGQANQSVRQWEAEIQDVVAACNGNTQAAQELEPFLQSMEAKKTGAIVIPVLRRICDGERGVELTGGIGSHRCSDCAAGVRVVAVTLIPAFSLEGEGAGYLSLLSALRGRGGEPRRVRVHPMKVKAIPSNNGNRRRKPSSPRVAATNAPCNNWIRS